MSIVAGVDFGTQSVRVTLMDSAHRETLGFGEAPYPVKRSASDPLMATQSHGDHMKGLVQAMCGALDASGLSGGDIEALACDTTGSSVICTDSQLNPLCEYYLWCDHRAHAEAREITEAGRASGLQGLDWCGGSYSHEWGYAKVLHFLRHNPTLRDSLGVVLEHCDMVAATLCGIRSIEEIPRSVCAMGHKWMWNRRWGGLPPDEFLASVDPLLCGINDKLRGRYLSSDQIAGTLDSEWAQMMGLRTGIPVSVGAFDAHWDALGAGCRPGDVVNVVGTSTCIIALGEPDSEPVAGLCGLAMGSVHPAYMGIEAGQSATGDLFGAIARRAGCSIESLTAELSEYRPASTGLLRIPWDNGDRTVLVRSDLGGMTLGWNLDHSPVDELQSAIEGMAMHVRIILDRMNEGGIRSERVINAGGVPQKNTVLNQIYADVLNRDILVPQSSPVGVGSCIIASQAARGHASIEQAQNAMCPDHTVFRPDPKAVSRYDDLFVLFSDIYFGFGEGRGFDAAAVLPALSEMRHLRAV